MSEGQRFAGFWVRFFASMIDTVVLAVPLGIRITSYNVCYTKLLRKDTFIRTRSEGFGDEVKRRIMLGNFVLSSGYYDAYYVKAQKVRQLIKREYEALFKEVDLILSPVAPSTAYEFGALADPMEMYLSDIYTISVNLAGSYNFV